MTIFANNLKKARTLKGWSQEGAASAIGIKRRNLGMYEEGLREPPHDILTNIANAYNIYDLYRFINDPSYFETKESINEVVRRYTVLQHPIKKAVDILLGFGF
jgi:transcriptional regulator with XRE-family HTH domain